MSALGQYGVAGCRHKIIMTKKFQESGQWWPFLTAQWGVFISLLWLLLLLLLLLSWQECRQPCHVRLQLTCHVHNALYYANILVIGFTFWVNRNMWHCREIILWPASKSPSSISGAVHLNADSCQLPLWLPKAFRINSIIRWAVHESFEMFSRVLCSFSLSLIGTLWDGRPIVLCYTQQSVSPILAITPPLQFVIPGLSLMPLLLTFYSMLLYDTVILIFLIKHWREDNHRKWTAFAFLTFCCQGN